TRPRTASACAFTAAASIARSSVPTPTTPAASAATYASACTDGCRSPRWTLQLCRIPPRATEAHHGGGRGRRRARFGPGGISPVEPRQPARRRQRLLLQALGGAPKSGGPGPRARSDDG